MSAVDLRDVLFGWAPGTPLLSIDRLEVAPGERVFISGPSGSGKSTLLGLIGGVLTPDSGTVRVLGESLGELSAARRDALRVDRIGFIFQMFNLLPYLSVRDNVALPCRFSARRRARALTEATDIRTEAERLLGHLGLDDPALLDRRVTELSIGQQQRVAAARALIGRPELVIADEPTSSLDTDARGDFLALLMRECTAAGSAIVFVSHDRSLAARFDRRVELAELNGLTRRTAA
ncbi:MAG: ABC transporter ATP-binding protein [Gammaproteobacteria bacterium]|nr:ABC transporter ATP-binding protein [Gammaproteobacteria bacterium]